MSLKRLVYYSAVIGGWSAFLGWLIAEFAVLGGRGPQGTFDVAVMCAIVGASIGAGLNVVAGMANAQWKQLFLRIWPGLLGGGIGGALGGSLGNLMKAVGVPRAIGFMITGVAIGIVEGVYERSRRKIRNGIIGGAIGGFLGGFILDWLLGQGQGLSSRATAFALLGISIGALIGFTQLILREAWLKVLDGYGVGRELILSKDEIILGRADHLPLPFLGPLNKDVAREHLRIVRQPDGHYLLFDNGTPLGTSLNHQPVRESCPLSDGDLIKFGPNLVRFCERRKSQGPSGTTVAAAPSAKKMPPPPKAPPPPPAGRTVAPTGQPPPIAPASAPTAQTSQSSAEPKLRQPPPPPPPKR